MNAIESKIQFIKDDDYVYFNEFIYKIFKFKYTKLDQNIFQLRTKSMLQEENSFDDIIQEMTKNHIKHQNDSFIRSHQRNHLEH